MRIIVMTLLLLGLVGCESADAPKTASKPLPDIGGILEPSPTPEPTLAPSPTPTPAPPPSPSPSPTPYPLAGTWRKADNAAIVFEFRANGTGGEASCQWAFEWSEDLINGNGDAGQVQLTFVSGTNVSPAYCVPAVGPIVDHKPCSWNNIGLDSNHIQLNCHYLYGGALFVRVP